MVDAVRRTVGGSARPSYGVNIMNRTSRHRVRPVLRDTPRDRGPCPIVQLRRPLVGMLAAASLAGSSLLAGAVPAQASTGVSVSGGVLRVNAATNRANAITVAIRDVTDVERVFRIQDSGDTPVAGRGCNQVTTRTVECDVTGIKSIIVNTHDRNDTVTLGQINHSVAVDVQTGEGNDTITGGANPEILDGGPGNDTIAGNAGNDTIHGRTGNDVLEGGAGDDNVRGQQGNDSVIGGAGDDVLNGHEGDDRVSGGDGRDVMYGGVDQDRLDGGAGNDTIEGHPGNDILYGSAGDDTLLGSEGDDRAFGNEGRDRIVGGPESDLLDGGPGNDRINGSGGKDTIDGRAGNDVLHGDDGDDTIRGRSGDDQLVGGDGKDTLDGVDGALLPNDRLDGGRHHDVCAADPAEHLAPGYRKNCEA